jgi:deoxyribonuclease IV
LSKAIHLALPFRFGTVGTPISAPKSGGSAGGIGRIREMNLSALELAWVRGTTNISTDACARIRAAAEANDVALSVHATYFFNLNAETDAMWQAGRERLLQAARLGAHAGATDIIFHPGSYMKRQPEAAFKLATERLKEILRTLDKEKVRVTLRPETMGKRALMGTLEETLDWSAQFENVLPCVDFAHLHARPGDGSFNTHAEFAAALALIGARLGERGIKRMHVHFSGIAYGEKGERHHLNLEEADADYKALFRAIAESGAAGRILSETPNMEEGAVVMQNTYQSALRSAAAKSSKSARPATKTGKAK